ncbi:DUF5060 domain-containing protein [Fulvivirgaceae bacterium BMA12]|uniref:DUF5060 domain-containing protein n=1 Tax=Agaribacillus aureus TaxID=3051825 RepID=A0ABT8L7N6_9BACT|nr:DUF5060 domain-containing protein [Fulvivirgaceae bacterium BMA12]
MLVLSHSFYKNCTLTIFTTLKKPLLALLIFTLFASCSKQANDGGAIKEYRQWHTITLNFEGPATSEMAAENPFLDYRLNVTFSRNGRDMVVPGYYAADGNTGDTGADSGKIWQVKFVADEEGDWNYSVSFRKGPSISINDAPEAGEPVAFDGTNGRFKVIATDKTGRDLRAHGRLQYNGLRYLQFAGSKQYFLKGGADSPENFLAYQDFDGTYSSDSTKTFIKSYPAHIGDWKTGDITWKGGKGKGIIGALNYLAEEKMNAVYFLTMNIGGDGKDVWPYVNHQNFERFDCSKLDQWEKVFTHADKLGLMLHFVTQETENELLLDNGDVGPQRKLYYRELIARFAHHLAITWNLGEENGPASFTPHGQNDAQRKAMASYFDHHDPYQNFTVVHTHAALKAREPIVDSLLGYKALDGLSIQIGNKKTVHRETLKLLNQSIKSGHTWVLFQDEIGPANAGAVPDDVDPVHDTLRQEVLWGNLMAGGAGVEWYFGYKYAHNDLNAEDWRTRKNLWRQTAHALAFFQQHLPFWEMSNLNDLTSSENAYCFGKKDEVYAIYLRQGDHTRINLEQNTGKFHVKWFDPLKGGPLKEGPQLLLEGSGWQDLPKLDDNQDWVVLLKRA